MTSPIRADDKGSLSYEQRHPTEWSQPDVDFWLASLSPSTIFKLYSSQFQENDIEGEALINLDPETLKEIGVGSIGHRLVILRGIYDLKLKWGIEVEPGDWRPDESHQSTASSSYTTQSTLASVSCNQMLRALKERDERVKALETELARLEDWLGRSASVRDSPSSGKVEPLQPYSAPYPVYSFIPDDLLPRAPSMNDAHSRTQQSQTANGTLHPGATSSTMVHTPSSAYSGPLTASSPSTFVEPQGSTASEDPSRSMKTPTTASLSFNGGAPDHSITSLTSPVSATNPSVGSSAESHAELSPTTSTPSATPTSAHYPVITSTTTAASAPHEKLWQHQVKDSSPTHARNVTSNNTNHSAQSPDESRQASSAAAEGTGTPSSGAATASANGKSSDNPYKSFRVTLEDPCHKVLPAALKKYKINDDWRLYALFICHGSTERCLSYDEKPLLLFQKLKEAKQNPVFMLRHIRDVKSPIAIANAKAAARKGSNEGSSDGKTTSSSTSGSKLDSKSQTTAKSKTAGKVADAVAKFGGVGGKDREDSNGVGEHDLSGKNATEDNMIQSPPGQAAATGPAAMLEPSMKRVGTFAIAIYPYVSEREDEFDVAVGDTFLVLSKAKGWWVVQRDRNATGSPDIVGVVRRINEDGGEGEELNGGEIKSGWVPAGCLLETSRPLASVVGPTSPRTPSDGSMAAAQAAAAAGGHPQSPGARSDGSASTPTLLRTVGSNIGAKMARAPIPPHLITSTSTPGILLMDYSSPEDGISLPKDIRLRVFKRYNHWSYCVVEGDGHARAWLPSWYIGKIGGSSRGGGSRDGSTPQSNTSHGAHHTSSTNEKGSAKSEALPFL